MIGLPPSPGVVQLSVTLSTPAGTTVRSVGLGGLLASWACNAAGRANSAASASSKPAAARAVTLLRERSRPRAAAGRWAEIGREIVRIEQAIRDKDDRVLKEYGDLQACLKRIVELKDLHRSSSPGTMIHGFATWRSRRLPGGGF